MLVTVTNHAAHHANPWHNSHSTRTLFLWDGVKGRVQVSKGDQNKIVIGVVIVIICFTWPISRKIITFLLCNELLALVLMFNIKKYILYGSMELIFGTIDL